MDWENIQNKLCSLDLETDENSDIFAIGAILQSQIFQNKAHFNIQQTLTELDDFSKDADFILGHNIILHDLPVYYALNPQLDIFNKPVIDTLFLSPWLFLKTPITA